MSSDAKPDAHPQRRWLAIGIGLAAAAGALSLMIARAQTAPAPVPAAVVELTAADVTMPQVRELSLSIPLTGALRPREWTTVKMKVAGEIQQILVREGELVKKGQVIARMDTLDFQSRLDEKIADLEGGRAQLALAEKNRANQLALLQQKFISQNAFDSTQSTLQVNEARLKALEAQVRLARKALDDTVVRAPIGGIVSQRLAQPGEKLPVDAKLVELMDLAELEVEAAVPASDIPSIRIGQQVSFLVEGFGAREFRGSVGRINPATQAGSRSIFVYALIPNADGALKGGMFAKGAVTVSRVERALVVPLSAVRIEEGQAVVYRVTGSSLQRQPVRLGLRNEDDGVVQVVEGLDAQSQIVKTNLGALRAGAQVKIAAPRPAATAVRQ